MKKIARLLLLVGMTGAAQISGNGIIITDRFDVKPIKSFELNMYANVTLDASLSSVVVFKGESNLLENIDFEVVNGKLNLQQKKWIEPTKPIEITIGVPEITSVQVDSHETVKLINLDQERIALTALIGEIEASGSVKVANMNSESGKINARDLKADTAVLNIWKDGSAIINASNEVKGKVSEEARLSLVVQPENISPTIKRAIEKHLKADAIDTKYITVKIKNNSWNRNHFEVKGPKPDGGRFGYGFPMMPGTVKKERWTVGTKVYKTGRLGKRIKLLEIKDEDAGKTLDLFVD